MAKYNSREALFRASLKQDETSWNNWIMSLCVNSTQVTDELYHISFKNNLPKRVIPQSVFNDNGVPHELYNEPLPPRLSTAPSILGCWRGIYANYSDLFERASPLKQISAHVYRVTPSSSAQVLTPQTATREWLLYDAHKTNEHCIFGEATLDYLGEIIIANTAHASNEQWDTFHPFNLPKYKLLYSNPPFKLIASALKTQVTMEQESTPESHMTDIVTSHIHALNEESLEVISTEAISNPLKTMTEVIKNRLHRIVESLYQNKLTSVKAVNAETQASVDFQVAHKQNRGQYHKTNSYIDLKNVLITVPVGFTGDLIGYAEILTQQNKAMLNLAQDVIEPTHNLILKYIGKPETMSSISNSDFGKVKLHDVQTEKFKKQMNHYFSAKQKHQTLPVGKLIKNLNQFNDLADVVNLNVVPFEKDLNTRALIWKSYHQLQKSIDLLLVRIEQKPEQYQLNKLNAERLAKLINDVAVEIELYSALVTYNSQLIVCVAQLQNRLLEKMD